MDNPSKQPLVAAALGEAAALSFTVHLFPPHKSNQGMEIKGKKLEAWKEILQEAAGRGRAHSGLLRGWQFLDLDGGTEESL